MAKSTIQKFLDISFLLTDKEVRGKRYPYKENRKIPEIINNASEDLELSPLDIKSVAVELIQIKRTIMHLSPYYTNQLIAKEISSEVNKLSIM